ncbi:hypothetical protein [Dactylosporangium sp. NPDC048998]|uniref:hypothetical protein n=1 Tax=Dactylosporangium sp. NPDC048998 TaxID=3363976 RepID=UPI00371C0A18
MTTKVRRRLALGLLVAAAAIATVAILATADGGQLQVNPPNGGHVYLRPLAHPFLGVAIAAAMLATAAQLAVQHAARRFSAQAAAALVAAVALFLGMLGYSMGDALSDESVVATSADFKVVSYRSPGFFSSDRIVLRVRTREGLTSREGSENLACFIDQTSGAGPEWLFDRASFTGNDEIAVFAKDGTMWRIRFNTRTLSALGPLDRCTEAPDAWAD